MMSSSLSLNIGDFSKIQVPTEPKKSSNKRSLLILSSLAFISGNGILVVNPLLPFVYYIYSTNYNEIVFLLSKIVY